MGSVCSCISHLFQNNKNKLILYENPKYKKRRRVTILSKSQELSPIEDQLLDNDFLAMRRENSVNSNLNLGEIKGLNSLTEKNSKKSSNSLDSVFPQEDEKLWFLPNCSRENAERLLKGRKDGTFLVRDSIKLKGKYILSLVIGGHIKHIVINKSSEGYSLYGNEKHPTLMSLVMFYANPFDHNSSAPTDSCTNLHFPIFQDIIYP